MWTCSRCETINIDTSKKCVICSKAVYVPEPEPKSSPEPKPIRDIKIRPLPEEEHRIPDDDGSGAIKKALIVIVSVLAVILIIVLLLLASVSARYYEGLYSAAIHTIDVILMSGGSEYVLQCMW